MRAIITHVCVLCICVHVWYAHRGLKAGTMDGSRAAPEINVPYIEKKEAYKLTRQIVLPI